MEAVLKMIQKTELGVVPKLLILVTTLWTVQLAIFYTILMIYMYIVRTGVTSHERDSV